MKKNTLFAIIIMALATVSCKKDNKDSRDYTALFKNTVWTGEFNYTGKAKEPVSIEFNESGQFTWYELSGEYAGTWKIEKGEISVSFPSGSGFKAGISNDNKLTNIQNLAINNWAMDNAGINTTADEPIDNTQWNSLYRAIVFKAGDKVDLYALPSIANIENNISYTRKAKCIRFIGFHTIFFSVFSTTSVMNAIEKLDGDPVLHLFMATKQ